MTTLTRNKAGEFILLNIGLIGAYFAFFSVLSLPVSDEFMFSTVDSKTYQEVAEWIGGGEKTNSTNIRPVFYPFIIWLTSASGATGLWVMQVLMWIAGGNFLYAAIRNYSLSLIAGIAGIILYAINLSLIGLTLHGITEVTTVFLLTVLTWHLSRYPKRFNEPKFLAGFLFIIGLLVITKPLFYPVFLLSAIIALFVYLRNKPRLAGGVLLIVSTAPVVTQLALMKLHHNTFAISTIGKVTVQQYLLTYAYADMYGLEYYEAKPVVWRYNEEQVGNFIAANYTTILRVFAEKMNENVCAKSMYLTNPGNQDRETWTDFMYNMNRMYCRFHNLFLIITPGFVLLAFRRNRNQWMIPVLVSVLMSLYIIVTSGVSGYQGDRLVLSAIPLWIFAYTGIAGSVFYRSGTRLRNSLTIPFSFLIRLFRNSGEQKAETELLGS